MITACYTMNVYCENDDYHSSDDTPYKIQEMWSGQFTGKSYAGCARQAKAAGWWLSRDRMRAYCPHCVETKRRDNE